MADILSSLLTVGLFASMIRLAVPLILGSLGEIMSERSGVLNLGVEGMMMMGAFSGFAACYAANNPWVGLLAAMFVGGLMGLLVCFLCVKLPLNQAIIGVVLSFVLTGLADFLFGRVYGIANVAPTVKGFEDINIPFLSGIPSVGPVLFQNNAITYFAYVLVPVFAFILYRTTLGLRIRAVGTHPRAADTVGINVFHTRYLCVILGGMMAGAAGASLSLGILNVFTIGMTSGRGWIVIALVIFSKWDPLKALGGALLFGFLDAFQIQVQLLGLGIPYQFLLMIPYVLTLVALLTLYRGKSERPASLGIPYKR